MKDLLRDQHQIPNKMRDNVPIFVNFTAPSV